MTRGKSERVCFAGPLLRSSYYGYGFEIQVAPVTIVVDAPPATPVAREVGA